MAQGPAEVRVAAQAVEAVPLDGLRPASGRIAPSRRFPIGVDPLAWVAGPAGAWTSLAALGVVAWLPLAVTLGDARA